MFMVFIIKRGFFFGMFIFILVLSRKLFVIFIGCFRKEFVFFIVLFECFVVFILVIFVVNIMNFIGRIIFCIGVDNGVFIV